MNVEQSTPNEVGRGQQEGQLDKVNSIWKPTSKRWIILVLYCLSTGNKAFHWIQVPAVTTQAARFYRVNNYVINFSSTISMVASLIMSWPACFIIDKIGMRKTMLISVLGSSVAVTIKCISCHNPSVYLLVFGEIIGTLHAQLIYCMPSRLVSIWFPDHQVSLALSICMLGGELGIALGFMVPQWFLSGTETKEEIGIGLIRMFFWTAAFSCSLLVSNLIAFDEAPPQPPGEARAKQIELEQRKKTDNAASRNNVIVLLRQILDLLRNKDLMLVACIYAIGLGRSDAIESLMDQTMRPLFPDNQSVVGLTGCLIIAAGAVGLPIWGRMLDKWRAYKKMLIITSLGALSALSCLTYAAMYLKSVPLVYLAAILYGLFQTGFMVTALELAVELTYPAPELVTCSLFNISAAITGPACILSGSYIINTFGSLATNMFLLVTILVGLICVLCTKERLRRQGAIQS